MGAASSVGTGDAAGVAQALDKLNAEVQAAGAASPDQLRALRAQLAKLTDATQALEDAAVKKAAAGTEVPPSATKQYTDAEIAELRRLTPAQEAAAAHAEDHIKKVYAQMKTVQVCVCAPPRLHSQPVCRVAVRNAVCRGRRKTRGRCACER